MTEVPGLPGAWKVTPTRREALSLSLQGGGVAQFLPHGFGTGYTVGTRDARGARRLPAETSAFFGLPGRTLFYTTFDHD